MSNNNMQQTTFWEFLKKQKIEIPIIQRDYAQGRIGKEKLREKFLTDLKNALEGLLSKDEKKLKLDFVYGSVENDRLNPLDGQQRLTTLWLLHWFIANKAGKLSENKSVFRNFSYETRTSSREFCKKLSDFELDSVDSIVKLIQKQTWFFSVWKQDPTIQAMFNMLGGTPIKDSKDNEILDGIEEVFKDCDYSSYWEKLTSKDCPIIFYYLDLLELSLSDDLYIKMNARGKALTNFENFKADLVGFIKEKEYDKCKNPDESIAHKLDSTWTDIFWKHKSKEHKIDDIYFAFINRYFLNELITAKELEKDFLYTQVQIESNKLFKYLDGKSSDDSNVKYDSFDLYRSEEEIFNDKLFERFDRTLDNFYSAFKEFSKEDMDTNSLFLPSWDSKCDFYFIPEYENKEGKDIPTLLTRPRRVVFFAICSYFENNQYNETDFRQWMRVVWNIVENANIETIASMIGAMRLIDELKPYANNIFNYLAESSTVIKSDTAKEQVAEEKEKAIKIVNDTTNIWERKIIEAERTAFFKGAIRFLFRIDVNTYDWNKFDERFEKSKLYFDVNGATEKYKKDAILLRILISKFSEIDHFMGEIFDNNAASWNRILNNEKLTGVLNQLFDITDILTIDFTVFYSSIIQERLRDFQNDLCKSTILNCISPYSSFHWWNHDKYSLFPYRSKSNILVLADKRNQIISALDRNIIEVENWQRVEYLPYFRGWKLYFTLISNQKKYEWWDSLKEQTENGEWKVIPDVNLENLEEYLTRS